jgi:hypothetical protein
MATRPQSAQRYMLWIGSNWIVSPIAAAIPTSTRPHEDPPVTASHHGAPLAVGGRFRNLGDVVEAQLVDPMSAERSQTGKSECSENAFQAPPAATPALIAHRTTLSESV